jgi:hypothetical protein
MAFLITIILTIIECTLIILIFRLYFQKKLSKLNLFEIGIILILIGAACGSILYIFQLGLDFRLQNHNLEKITFDNIISLKSFISISQGILIILTTTVGGNFISHHLINMNESSTIQKDYMKDKRIENIFIEVKKIKKLLNIFILIIFLLIVIILILLLK